ncbi:riboflavin synthase [Portibacter marinus]|uniref:riboflavin synthase n=1 Tax=Portibacter marinus TaxID=2898660 RepID=UPI001F254BE9|nr:riboflavin synthase [Portibacter marinus]
MFTGIIESVGKVTSITKNGTNKSFWVESNITSELKVDQSVSHNGVCLTVVAIQNHLYQVTIINETLQKSNLGEIVEGSHVNLERSLTLNQRLDGHIVQGHVDATGKCTFIKEEGGSWVFSFTVDKSFNNYMVEKGSICINGVSLTLVNVGDGKFSVAIIPYTYEHTTFSQIRVGDKINLEFDILGKYFLRFIENQKR